MHGGLGLVATGPVWKEHWSISGAWDERAIKQELTNPQDQQSNPTNISTMKVIQFITLATVSLAVAASPSNANLRHRAFQCAPEFECKLADGREGYRVCVSAFSPCMALADIKPEYACGPCPAVEKPRGGTVAAQPSSLPKCTSANVGDFECALGDGSTGVLSCTEAFSACRKVEDAIADGDGCGCCVGDTRPFC